MLKAISKTEELSRKEETNITHNLKILMEPNS